MDKKELVCDNCGNVLEKGDEDKFTYCQENNQVYCSSDCTLDALYSYGNCKSITLKELQDDTKVEK